MVINETLSTPFAANTMLWSSAQDLQGAARRSPSDGRA